MNAIITICKTEIPSEEVFWNLFWNTLTRSMADFENTVKFGTPAMIKEVLDTYGRALENPEIASFSPVLIGLRHFIFSLHREINIYPYWSNSELGAQIGHAILCHPVWEKIHASVFAVPLDPETEVVRSHLAFLANFKKRRNLEHVGPPSLPGILNIIRIPSDESPRQPVAGSLGGGVDRGAGAPGVPAVLGRFLGDVGQQRNSDQGVDRRSLELHMVTFSPGQSGPFFTPGAPGTGQPPSQLEPSYQVLLPLPIQMQRGPLSNPIPLQQTGQAPPQIVEIGPFQTIGAASQRPVIRDTLPSSPSAPTLPATLPLSVNHGAYTSTASAASTFVAVDAAAIASAGSVAPDATISDPSTETKT